MAHRSTWATGTHLLTHAQTRTETHTEDVSSNWPPAQSTQSPALASFYLQSLALRGRSRATPRLHGLSRSQLLQVSLPDTYPGASTHLFHLPTSPTWLCIGTETLNFSRCWHQTLVPLDLTPMFFQWVPYLPQAAPSSAQRVLRRACPLNHRDGHRPSDHGSDHPPGTASGGGRSGCSSICQGCGGSPTCLCSSVLLCLTAQMGDFCHITYNNCCEEGKNLWKKSNSQDMIRVFRLVH